MSGCAKPSSRAPLSAAVDAVVLRCLEKKAERRFASARDLLSALRVAIGEAEPERSERDLPALGVLLSLQADDGIEVDDDMLEDMMNVFDRVEQCLSTQQFVFPLRAATTLLAVRVAQPGSELGPARHELQGVLEELHSALAEREPKHPAVRIVLSLRAADVRCLNVGPEPEIVGGPLLALSTWDESHHVHA